MLEQYIREKQKSRSLLLMTHIIVGYPSLDDNWDMLMYMQNASIDLVELQLPFSEPIADGPVFIKANQASLDNGTRWDDYFDFFSRANTEFKFPLLYMGYYNSVFCMGHERFCNRLKSSGAAGYIIADLPIELADDLDSCASKLGLDAIHIQTPVNSAQRLQEISNASSGFLYCVARKGVTGRETEFNVGIVDYLQRCRGITNLPLALGFGINSDEQIRQLKGITDIAIVGSACLEVWEQHGQGQYKQFLSGLDEAR